MPTDEGERSHASVHSAFLVDAEDKATLFRHLARAACDECPLLDTDAIAEELLAREGVFPTGLGHGIALPHIHVNGLANRLCLAAILRQPIEFNAPDKQPVRLVFFLLSPAHDPEGHLLAMAGLARTLCGPANRERILSVADPDELMRLLAAP